MPRDESPGSWKDGSRSGKWLPGGSSEASIENRSRALLQQSSGGLETMQCRYCRAWNEEDERRCVRCGRRMQIAQRHATDSFPLSTATAPALEMFPGRDFEAQPAQPEIAAAKPEERVSYQPSLFRDVSNGPK